MIISPNEKKTKVFKIAQKMKKQQNHYKSNRFGSSSGARHSHKAAELFRTDFITAMKLPDTESLDDDSYWLIKDQWKLDWEKGVQVPVKPDNLNTPNCAPCKDQFDLPFELTQAIRSNPNAQLHILSAANTAKISMPKKYLCPANDKNYRPTVHQAYITHGLSQNPPTTTNANASTPSTTNTNEITNSSTSCIDRSVCKYDCDQMDMAWLARVNAELDLAGIERIGRLDLERFIESFELQSYEALKAAIDKLQSYSIEYDEDIVCDVCREPDSEENNEMVFCDGCNMCVHQACYGIETIPKGNWLCAPCTFGGPQFRPECVLCPQTSGAMKATKNFRHWVHVSCALWIPETSFGSADKMEPIMNLNAIAPARWQLVCSLCKEKRGCCLQCSERRCHAAFHVTCGFKYGLEMKTFIAGDGQIGDREITACAPSGSKLAAASPHGHVVFRAYCQRHTKRRAQMQQEGLLEDEEEDENEEVGEEEEDDNEEDEEDTQSEEVKSPIINQEADKQNGIQVSVQTDEKNFFNALSKMSENERKLEIIKQIKLLNYEFYKNVNLSLTESQLSIKNQIHLQLVFNYWKLKRRYNISTITSPSHLVMPIQNKPLIVYRSDQDLINRSERMLISKIREFIRLRQSLEKVRNLCYMVVKREKMKSSFFRLKQQLFSKQIDYVNRYCSQNDLSMLNSTSSIRGGRLKDILQVKNDQCIYDFPEMWNNAKSSNTETSMIFDLDEDDTVKTNKKSGSRSLKKSKKRLFKRTENKLAKNIVHKYNMLKYRRNAARFETTEINSHIQTEKASREKKTKKLDFAAMDKRKKRESMVLKRKSAISAKKKLLKKQPFS